MESHIAKLAGELSVLEEELLELSRGSRENPSSTGRMAESSAEGGVPESVPSRTPVPLLPPLEQGEDPFSPENRDRLVQAVQSVIEENAERELRDAGDEKVVTTILTLDQSNVVSNLEELRAVQEAYQSYLVAHQGLRRKYYVFGRPPGAHEQGFSECERELEELRRQFRDRVFAACGQTRGQELLRRLSYSLK